MGAIVAQSPLRFYLLQSTPPPISPNFDAGWEQTGQAIRGSLVLKSQLSARETLADTTAITVPITTTQEILAAQFIGPPMRACRLDTSVLVQVINRCAESAAQANVNYARVLRALSQDGGTILATLFTNITGTGAEFSTTSNSRHSGAPSAVTAATLVEGWRIVDEIGAHAAAPTQAQSYTMRFGNSASSDFNSASDGQTGDLNPWLEFSAGIFQVMPDNYQSVRSSGLSVSERIR